MGDVIKLSQFRKQKAKADKDALAAGNRRKYGRTKGERALEDHKQKKDETTLDQHKLPPETDPKS